MPSTRCKYYGMRRSWKCSRAPAVKRSGSRWVSANSPQKEAPDAWAGCCGDEISSARAPAREEYPRLRPDSAPVVASLYSRCKHPRQGAAMSDELTPDNIMQLG